MFLEICLNRFLERNVWIYQASLLYARNSDEKSSPSLHQSQTKCQLFHDTCSTFYNANTKYLSPQISLKNNSYVKLERKFN